jgi:hypothetical protein
MSHPIYRALVTFSDSVTGEVRVKIPSLLGVNSEVSISYIGRSAPWSVPSIGAQIVVTSDDANLTNVFWVQTDQMAQSPTFDYKVGDTGPGGGIIFFVDRYNEYSGFTYLEVAPVSTAVTREWATDVNSNQITTVSGADSKALGAGYQNTIDIVAQVGNVAATCAAKYCADLTFGGQSDWYLPSIAELKMIYEVAFMHLSINFAYDYYWSSSEYEPYRAWSFQFEYGSPSANYKFVTSLALPIRRF